MTMLNVDIIEVSPFQFRSQISESKLAELKESIREHGIIEPLIVRQNTLGKFELVVGHRRLRAARELGLTEVPILVRQMNDEEVIFAQLIENLQREDASDYDIGKSFNQLIAKGYTQIQIADKIGLSQAHVSRYLDHYGFIERAIIPSGINVDTRQLKESQTRDLRKPEIEPKAQKIISELKPEKVTSETIKEIWHNIRVEGDYQNQEVQNFLQNHDYMTSLLHYEDRGSFGDSAYAGNSPGFLLVQLIHHFKPKLVFDPMEGSGTNRDVCKAMNIEYVGNDLLKNGYNLVTKKIEELPLNDLTFFHPPYWNLIRYSNNREDLCNAESWEDFLAQLNICMSKLLKRTKILVVLIGDIVRNGHFRSPLCVLPCYEKRIYRILIKSSKIVTGLRGFYDSISKGDIPQTHEYVILLRGDLYG
jgi:ParB family chromosome partitioning protein